MVVQQARRVHTCGMSPHSFSDNIVVPASSLQPRDQFHHWSSTGGLWTVDARLKDGRIKVRSDIGQVRYFTEEFIDSKGARLHVRAADRPVIKYNNA